MKTEQINTRVSPEIKKRMEEKAKSLGMSISEYMRHLIIKDIQEK